MASPNRRQTKEKDRQRGDRRRRDPKEPELQPEGRRIRNTDRRTDPDYPDKARSHEHATQR